MMKYFIFKKCIGLILCVRKYVVNQRETVPVLMVLIFPVLRFKLELAHHQVHLP